MNSQEELIKTIRGFKQRSKANLPAGFKRFLGLPADPQEGKGWACCHKIINYQGELINIKVPSLITRGIVYLRSVYDVMFNDGVTAATQSRHALEREAEIYKKLNEAGFPTFESRQELITDENGVPLVRAALLTKRLEGTSAMSGLIRGNSNKALEYVAKVTGLMRRLHGHNEIFVDNIYANTLLDSNGNLLLYDFGLVPNENLSFNFLQGKDLEVLCLASVGITERKPLEVVPAVLGSYNPSSELRQSLGLSLEDQLKRKISPLMKKIGETLYFSQLYGLNYEQVEGIKKELLKKL